MDKHHRCFMLGFCRPNVSILSQDQNKSLQIQWPSRVGYDIIIPDLYRNIAIQNVKFNKTPLYERNRLDNQRTEKINKIKHQERITENREANPELQIYIKPTTNVIWYDYDVYKDNQHNWNTIILFTFPSLHNVFGSCHQVCQVFHSRSVIWKQRSPRWSQTD